MAIDALTASHKAVLDGILLKIAGVTAGDIKRLHRRNQVEQVPTLNPPG